MLKAAIDAFKYRDGMPALAEPLGNALADAIERQFSSLPDRAILVPVPLAPKREQGRGFNQSLLLARIVAKRIGTDVAANLLIRTRETPKQVGLTASERKENVLRAFKTTRPADSSLTYIIVDDVTTTGSTIRACARALRADGAKTVFAATVAQG